MANTINTLTYVATEMLRQVKNNLQFLKNCDGEDITSRFTEMPKVGTSFTVRKPVRYSGRTGETYTVEDYTERTVSVAVQTTDGVDITLTNRELMFSLDKLQERVIQPAAVTLANTLDRKALQIATQATFAAVGTPGTTPTALKTYNQARAKIAWQGAPADNHTLLITPDMHVEAVDAGKALFNPNQNIAGQYERGLIGMHAGAKVYEIQDPYTHTVGPLGGTPLVNGAAQSGASLITDGWTAAAASRLKKGDIFTIANVNAVNPFTQASTGSLQQFTVTADVSSDGAGNLTAAISPAIVLTGPYKNVDVGPVDNAALTILGAANTVSPQGLRFQRECFIFGMCKQPEPGGVEFAKSLVDEATGISLRFIRDWDTANNKQLNRIDAVWAFGVAFPEWACRVAG
jgi:hypothetical protein